MRALQVPCYTGPRGAYGLDVFWRGFCYLLLLQIFLKDYGRGDGIHGNPGGFAFTFFVRGFGIAQEVAALLLQQALGLPTGEALVEHRDRHVQLFADARGKARGLFGHFAARAIEAQGQPDDNMSDVVLAHQLSETPHILVAIDAFQSNERARKGVPVSNRQADAHAAIVNPDNATARSVFRFLG